MCVALGLELAVGGRKQLTTMAEYITHTVGIGAHSRKLRALADLKAGNEDTSPDGSRSILPSVRSSS